MKSLLTAALLVMIPKVALGDCNSLYEESASHRSWSVHSDHRYELCYDEATPQDILGATIEWIEHAYEVGKLKYGVEWPIHARPCRDQECQMVELDLTIFVNPVNAPQRMNWCSYTTSGRCADSNFARDPRYDSRAEIHVNSVSNQRPPYGLTAEERFINTLVHEVMHFVQVGVVQARWPRWLPRWIIEGLATYEGWNTTPGNKRVFNQNLAGWVDQDEIVFGWDLGSLSVGDTSLHVTEPYHAGAMLSITLADLLGKEIYRELLRRPFE